MSGYQGMPLTPAQLLNRYAGVNLLTEYEKGEVLDYKEYSPLEQELKSTGHIQIDVRYFILLYSDIAIRCLLYLIIFSIGL